MFRFASSRSQIASPSVLAMVTVIFLHAAAAKLSSSQSAWRHGRRYEVLLLLITDPLLMRLGICTDATFYVQLTTGLSQLAGLSLVIPGIRHHLEKYSSWKSLSLCTSLASRRGNTLYPSHCHSHSDAKEVTQMLLDPITMSRANQHMSSSHGCT